MLATLILFTVISIILPINGTPRSNDRDLRLDAVINLLENRDDNDRLSSSSGSSDEEMKSLVDHANMRTMDVINLIKQANENKEAAKNKNHGKKIRAISKQFHQSPINEFKGNDNDDYGIKSQILEQFLNDERKPVKKSYHKRLSPNRLLSPYQYKYDDEITEQKGDLDENSKIFLILDPIAIHKSRNAGKLPKLISKILSQTSSNDDKLRQEKNAVQRYKGFVLHDNSKSRRFRRESKETYSGGGGGGAGDMDDDYRPKRARHEYGGGGGRTAIPYIRHRGDIYERDH